MKEGLFLKRKSRHCDTNADRQTPHMLITVLDSKPGRGLGMYLDEKDLWESELRA